MSTIAGILRFNEAAVDEGSLLGLSERLAHRGPDGAFHVLSKSIGMVYMAFHTNKDSLHETQPLVSSTRQVLTWDGRLDNRDDVNSALADDLQNDRTDVDIVMAAFQKWGADCFAKLIGDFALSLWDPQTRQLYLARDPIGPRTLYYVRDDEGIIWSSELAALLDATGIPLSINEEYVADFLTRMPEPDQTPYKNVYAVPPGHLLTIGAREMKSQRFWSLNPGRSIRYKTDAEYEEHFHHLFREAVRCRLRVKGTVWSELSGGLDSSSIVCMADDLIRKGEVEALDLQTVSLVFEEASKSDEREYISYVEKKLGKQGIHLCEDEYRMLAPIGAAHSSVLPNPCANSAEYWRGLNEVMRVRDGRLLLSGKGGDQILNSTRDPSPELTELLWRGRFLGLHQRLRIWSEALHTPYLSLLWRNAIWQCLPRRIQAKCGPSSPIADMFDPKFAKRMNLHERRLGPIDLYECRNAASRYQSISFAYVVRELSSGGLRRLSHADLSFPFTHLPLVEFMQAIPFEQRVRPYQSRSLVRRSLSNLLPFETANRKGKRLTVNALSCGLVREWERFNTLLKNARLCEYGYINHAALMRILNQARSGMDVRSLVIVFLMPLEYWLRAFETRRAERLAPVTENTSRMLVRESLQHTVASN
jgi:asparagine synthase (glutamine-hydrolysing)